MKHIPKEFIYDLVSRVNIVDVIGNRIKLKKKGNNYFGCCPFHNEKTPSFSVSDKRQMYHCFGCGESGSAINFLMNYERLSFPEAIEELANQQGIDVLYEESNGSDVKTTSQNNRRDLYQLLNNISSYYANQLSMDSSKKAQLYLNNRGLNSQTIAHYQIGYSPDDWNKTERENTKNSAEKTMYQLTGMSVVNDNNKSYDRFRGRIMFPIRDRQGNVVGFGGRTMSADDNVKYLNSPETPIFHKGKNLYGLFEALERNRNPERLLIVEGYMDVVSLAQFGIHYAVAALGTATTEDHIKLLFRVTDTLVFCYDGDKAGQRAAWRALNTLLPLLIDGKTIRFVFLPEDDDPDSLVRKEGKAEFENRLNNGVTLSQFMFDEILKQVDLSNSEGIAKLVSLVTPMIAQVNANAYQHNLKKMLGNYLGILDAQQLDQFLAKQNNNMTKTVQQPIIKVKPKIKITTMRTLIGLLVQNPSLVKLIPQMNMLSQVNLAGIDLFIELCQTCLINPSSNTAQILTLLGEHQYINQLKLMANWDHAYDENKISSIFSNTLKALYDNILDQRRDMLIAKERTDKLSREERVELSKIALALSKKD